MAYGCLGIRLTLVMCLMLDIKLTLYQNFIYMVSYNRENSFQSYIIQHKLVNMLPRSPTPKITALGAIVHMEPFTYEAYKEEYAKDRDFKEAYQWLLGQQEQVDKHSKVDYRLQDGFLYKMEKFCLPKEEKVELIREVHISKVVGHLINVGKIMAN
jgi:hypothetical protein